MRAQNIQELATALQGINHPDLKELVIKNMTQQIFEFCLMQGWVKPSDWAFQTQPRETNNV